MNSFENRLKKNLKSIRTWADKFPCTAYRVYDRDIPEYAVSVDYYQGYLVVYRYFNKKFAERDDANFRDIVAVLKTVFEVEEDDIFVKERARQKGLAQYEKIAGRSFCTEVSEGPLKFRVNLSDYLDTGLFLDHRASRKWVREKSAGLRVLNLFCYTGAVSVHAIHGGAKEVVSVDMSGTYLRWAEQNFQLNGMRSAEHPLIRADVLDWIVNLESSSIFDLIFLDPPAFSNSKKMKGDFEVQRDHGWLVEACMAHLDKAGVLFFSNNLRSFKLSADLADKYRVENITHKTSAPDFHNELIHNSWLVRHK